MKRKTATIVMALIMVLGAANAVAVWGWLRDAAVAEFTDADWEILQSEARRTLNEVADGERVDWNNPESGNGGSIKPLESFSYQGLKCRKVALRNTTASGLKGQGTFNLCLQEDNSWKFVAESSIKIGTEG